MIVLIAQIIGTASIFILFCINLFIISSETHFQRAGRVSILWITIYGFFLFVVRIFSLLGIATTDQLRIISGISALIPLVMVIIHLFLIKKIESPIGRKNIIKTILIMGVATLGVTLVTNKVIADPPPVDYRCSDFRTQEDAQRKLEESDDDIYRLDTDMDGLACEGLPKE